MVGKKLIVWGAVLTAIAIVMGAFGAHGLRGWVEQNVGEPLDQAKRIENWETASKYFLYHSVGVILIGLAGERLSPGLAKLAAGLMLIGVLLFSGCLYAWVFTNSKSLVMIVPVGGLAFIAGWILFAISAHAGPGKDPAGASRA
jgi:uncharacterized membrane protein YgdD (TMEM256/DUF423 family)